MSGARTKTGCWTCRIRKKKCDEEHPICGTCRSRNIHCYGYDAPPTFMEGKRNRNEILNTKEALHIRASAEEQYKARRRKGLTKRKKTSESCKEGESEIYSSSNESNFSSTIVEIVYGQPHDNWVLECPSPINSEIQGISNAVVFSSKDRNTSSSSISPLPLESIWWDSDLSSSLTGSKRSKKDVGLLAVYLDVIFQLQFGFYPLATSTDRSWLLKNLSAIQPLYHATLGLAACFKAGIKGPPQTENFGITTDVRKWQTIALHGLQTDVDRLGAETLTQKELLKRGVKTLAVMNQLLSLEVFSMMEGHWELHLQAARTLLGMIQSKYAPDLFQTRVGQLSESPIEKALLDSSFTDDRKTLEFHINCFIWIDILAAATHGPHPPSPNNFNYLPLLRHGRLNTQRIMGCQTWAMLLIAEITALEDWKRTQMSLNSLSTLELATRTASLAHQLTLGIKSLERESHMLDATSLDEDSKTITLIFAFAALIYLHVTISGPYPAVPEILVNVRSCLERLEKLPSRLVLRVCWPYVMAGCMATEELYDRFREVVRRTERHGALLGVTWKGLLVMEECWRLRGMDGIGNGEMGYGWREAMGSLGLKVLLV